jgi:hypothetical protein
MKIPLFTISLLLTLPAQDLKSQTVNPGAPARVPLPPPPVDPARVPSSASVEVETDAAQNPAPIRAGAKKPMPNETPSTVVVKPKNPFSGFRHIDRDENGTLSLKELTQAFRRADTDFDGLLSLDEFQRDIVDQPLDAGGVPDPPQIIVVPPASKEESDDASAGSATPQNRGRIRPGEATRRQSTPVDNNGDNQDDDLDDVDLNDIDQNDVDGVIQSDRSSDATTRRNATTDLNRVGNEPRRSSEAEPTATGTERRNATEADDSNATPRDSTRSGTSTSPNTRPRSSTQQRSGASSSGNASTRDSSTNSNRNNRSSGSTNRRATGSGGAGTAGASSGGGGGTSGGSSSSGGNR